jgi:hypothetical protein
MTTPLQIITIGDCTKAETRIFFRDRLLPGVPGQLRGALNFERLFDAFGGKLAHWHDYITDYGEVLPSFLPNRQAVLIKPM